MVQRSTRIVPSCRICNAYGPTEASSAAPCSLPPGDLFGLCSNRNAIANIKIHVLDVTMRPGLRGEERGETISRRLGARICDRPELTAERFVISPIDKSKLIYKTGRSGHVALNGNLRFIARADHR